MIRARINAKGAIAAPGAAQVLGRTLTLERADDVEIDISGYFGAADAICTVKPGADLVLLYVELQAGVLTLRFSGAGALALTIGSNGRQLEYRIVVRNA